MSQSLLSMKDRRETSLEINNPVPAQIFSLLVSDALQRFFRLHHGDGVCKAFQVFRQASLIGSTEKPFRECLSLIGWKILVSRIACQVDYSLRPQHAVQVLVQKDLGKALQYLAIKFHGMRFSPAEAKFIDREKTLQDDTPPDHLSIVCRFLLYNPTPA